MPKQYNGYKLCPTCERVMPLIMFNGDINRSDSYHNQCRECCKEYRTRNKEHIRKQRKEYRERTKEQASIYKKDYTIEHKEEIAESMRKYHNTPEGKLTRKRAKEKRTRNYGYIRIFNNPFPSDIKVDYHHINNVLVIPIPKQLHILNRGNSIENHRKLCKDVIKSIYCLDIEKLLEK